MPQTARVYHDTDIFTGTYPPHIHMHTHRQTNKQIIFLIKKKGKKELSPNLKSFMSCLFWKHDRKIENIFQLFIKLTGIANLGEGETNKNQF